MKSDDYAVRASMLLFITSLFAHTAVSDHGWARGLDV